MANKVNASHILVKTEQEALACLTYLKSKSFEELAREKSMCPSGKKGGSLGWFSRGMMVKEFENIRNFQFLNAVRNQRFLKCNFFWKKRTNYRACKDTIRLAHHKNHRYRIKRKFSIIL